LRNTRHLRTLLTMQIFSTPSPTSRGTPHGAAHDDLVPDADTPATAPPQGFTHLNSSVPEPEPPQDWIERLGHSEISLVPGQMGNTSAQKPQSQVDRLGSQEDKLGKFIHQNDQHRAAQDDLAAQYNASVLAKAMATGENLPPTLQTVRQLGMFNFEGNALAGTDRAALSGSLQLGLETHTALQIAPLVASVTEVTGMPVREAFAFGGTTHFPRSSWTANDFAMLSPWAGLPTQRAAFESALLQTGSPMQATDMAVLSAVRERLVDKLPAQIQIAQGPDQQQLTRMHGAMVNGLLSTDVYFGISIPEILPRGYSRMSAADLPASLGLRSFEDANSGYFGALYRNADNGTVIYANRGTEGLDKLDVRANILQAFGLKSGQYTNAMKTARDLRVTYGDKLSFTGHSLGGGLASAQALVTGLPATTFNAAGLNPETVRRMLGSDFDNAWARGNNLVSAYYVKGDPLSQAQDGAWLVAGTAARGRQIAINMAADPGLGFSAFNWPDKNLMLPLVNGDMQNGRVTGFEPNVLPRAVGTRYALEPTAAPHWLNQKLGESNPIPHGNALHSMATSVMYGLFGSVGRH